MNHKNAATDSGSYVNGVYTSKNGFSGTGLNCPKGTRLYRTDVIKPIFFVPPDTPPGEEFRRITQEVCPDILPYYAISNYGRLMNINSGKVMKPNYRPNGYEYYCLAAENSKTNQKKYNTNRIVMKTFEPREDADKLQVNHINGDKTQNYYKKVMPDGSIESNLEWSTPKENIIHSRETGLNKGSSLNMGKAKHIRQLKNQGYSYNRIRQEFYPEVSGTAIQMICKNQTYYDPDYRPKENYTSISYTDNTYNNFKFSDRDARIIRNLSQSGFTHKQIKERFYPDISLSTISDIVTYKTHNRRDQKLELKQSGAFGSVSPLKSK